jgi:hypothetical protein
MILMGDKHVLINLNQIQFYTNNIYSVNSHFSKQDLCLLTFIQSYLLLLQILIKHLKCHQTESLMAQMLIQKKQ